MTTLATFDIMLRGDTRQFEQSMGSAKRTGQSFIGTMTAMAGGFIMGNVVMAGFNKAVSFGQNALIGYNARMEQAAIGFKTLFGSADMAASFVEELRVFANKTPFDFPGLQQASNTMVAMGFAAQDVIPNLTAIGDLVAAMGYSGGEANQRINRLVYNLGQMKSLGRVTGRDIRDLSMLGLNATGILAKGFKVSTAAMTQMIAKGTVPADKALKMLMDGIEKGNMGGMMAEQAKTFNGAMSTIKDSVMSVAGTALKPLFNAIRDVVYQISLWVSDQRAMDWANKVGTYLRAAVIILQDFAGVLFNIKPAAKTAADGMAEMMQIKPIQAFFTSLKDGIIVIIRAYKTMIEGFLTQTVTLAKNLRTGGWNAIVAYADGMYAAYKAYVVAVVNQITGFISAYLIGNSPPKMGPLSQIYKGGKNTIQAWVDGAMAADLSPILNIPARIAVGLKKLEAASKYVGNVIQGIGQQIDILDLNMAKAQIQADRLTYAYQKAIEPLQKAYQILTDTYSIGDKKRDLENQLKKNALEQLLIAAKGDSFKQGQIQAQIDALDAVMQQNSLLEEQESLTAQIAGIPLEEQMKGMTDEYEKQLKPLQDQMAILQAQRGELEYQQKVWQAIATTIETAAQAMRETAAAASAATGAKGGIKAAAGIGDGGIPKPVKHEIPINTKLLTDQKTLEASAQAMADGLFTGFGNYVSSKWPTMLGTLLGGVIGAVIGGGPVGAALGAGIGSIVGGFFNDDIKKAAEDGVASIQAIIAGGFSIEGLNLPAFEDILKVVSDTYQGMFDWIVNTGVPMLATAAGQLWTGLWDFLGEVIPKVLPMLGRYINFVLGFIAKNVPVLLKKIWEWGQAFVGWIFSDAIPTLAKNLPKIIDAVIKFIGQLTSDVSDALGTFIDGFGRELGPGIGAIWDGFLGLAGSALGGLGDLLMGAAGAVIGWIGTLPGTILDILGQVVTAIAAFAASIPGMAFQAFVDFVAKAATGLLTLVVVAVTIFGQVKDKIVDFVTSMPGKALQFARDFVQNIRDFLGALPGKFVIWLGQVLTNVVTWFGDMKTKATDTGKGFVDNLMKFIGDIPTKIKDTFNGIVTWITTEAPKMATKFGDAAIKIGKSFANGIAGLIEGALNTIIRAINSIQIHFDGMDLPGFGRVGAVNWNGFQLSQVNLPRFLEGAWDTGKGGPALIDPHEMVLPKAVADKLRGAFDGGMLGQGVTVNGPLVNIEQFTGSDAEIDQLMTKMASRLRLATPRA